MIAAMSEEAGHFVRSVYDFNIRENDSGQAVNPNDSDELCPYVIVRGVNKGNECQQAVKKGSVFCSSCERRNHPIENKSKIVDKVILSFALRWKATKDLSFFRDNRTLTDITLIVNGVSFHAHKLILAIASPYFQVLLLSGFKEASDNYIILKDISSQVFGLYIDLMYGKEIIINNWRTAFDLFDYLKLTLINWNKDSTATLFHVPAEEYVEYIKRLYLLYDDDVARCVINKTGKYVTSTLDLSEFDPEFIELVRPTPPPEICVNFIGGDYYRETIKGLIIYGSLSYYRCLGYIPNELASLPFSFCLSSVLPLTPELKKYCESLGIPYSSDK